MITFQSAIGYLVVSVLWGCTNPFIKHAQSNNKKEDEETQESKSLMYQFKRAVKEPRILIPFGFNQIGSLAFYALLSTEPVSIASPVCNSLTFLFTALTSYFVFNETVKYPFYLFIGSCFILYGTYLCMLQDE